MDYCSFILCYNYTARYILCQMNTLLTILSKFLNTWSPSITFQYINIEMPNTGIGQMVLKCIIFTLDFSVYFETVILCKYLWNGWIMTITGISLKFGGMMHSTIKLVANEDDYALPFLCVPNVSMHCIKEMLELNHLFHPIISFNSS